MVIIFLFHATQDAVGSFYLRPVSCFHSTNQRNTVARFICSDASCSCSSTLLSLDVLLEYWNWRFASWCDDFVCAAVVIELCKPLKNSVSLFQIFLFCSLLLRVRLWCMVYRSRFLCYAQFQLKFSKSSEHVRIAKETMTFLKLSLIKYFTYNYDMYLYFSNKCTVSFIGQKGTKDAPNFCAGVSAIGFYMRYILSWSCFKRGNDPCR